MTSSAAIAGIGDAVKVNNAATAPRKAFMVFRHL
jgi:hypothetical protein